MAQSFTNILKPNFKTANSTPQFSPKMNRGGLQKYNSISQTLKPPQVGSWRYQRPNQNSTSPVRTTPGATGTTATTPGLMQPNRPSTGTPMTATTPGATQIIPTLPTTQPNNAPTSSEKPVKGVLSQYQNPTDYAQLLKQLQEASQTGKNQKRLLESLESKGQESKTIAERARALSEQYGTEIARVGQLGAGAVAGNLSTGTNVVGAGNAAIASQSASQRMSALSEAQQAALQGTAQQLTAQEQEANALSAALGAANTQQSQTIAGLSNTTNYAQPVQVAPGSTLFTPTGQTVAGGLGGYVNYQTAEQVMGLISQYPDAGYRYNENLTPQQNLQLAQQAISQSPTYQRGTFGVAGSQSYIGAQQLGAAGSLTQQVSQIQTQGAAADSNFALMLDVMKRGQVNNAQTPIINQLVQNVSRGVASDQDVVAFRSALQTVRSQYAAILGGGTPTDTTQMMAAEKIPESVSLSALQEVERVMKAMVNNTVAAYNQQISAYSGGQGVGGSFGGGNPFAEQW